MNVKPRAAWNRLVPSARCWYIVIKKESLIALPKTPTDLKHLMCQIGISNKINDFASVGPDYGPVFTMSRKRAGLAAISGRKQPLLAYQSELQSGFVRSQSPTSDEQSILNRRVRCQSAFQGQSAFQVENLETKRAGPRKTGSHILKLSRKHLFAMVA
jgi:hypothetical protein